MQAEDVSSEEGFVYVVELPAFALISALLDESNGTTAPPTVILGLDFLKRRYRMILRAPSNELWFEVLKNQISAAFMD